MPKSIALFDIDNTMYDGFSYFALLEKQVEEALITRQVLDDAKACMQKYKSQLQDYETTVVQLIDIYAIGLKGRNTRLCWSRPSNFTRVLTNFFVC